MENKPLQLEILTLTGLIVFTLAAQVKSYPALADGSNLAKIPQIQQKAL